MNAIGSPQPPCRVVALAESFRVEDANGRAVAYVYFGEGGRRSAMPGTWTREEANAIAERIARGFTRAGQRGAPAGADDAPRKT